MDYFDRIEEYLNNALSESDKIAFEEAMEEDLKLKQAVEDHGVAMDVVGSILEGEVRKVIDNEQLTIDNSLEERGKLDIAKEGTGNETKVKQMNWMRWVAAASVVFVLGWWGMNYNVRMEQDNRYAMVSKYVKRPTIDAFRGSDSVTNLYEEAIQFFNLNKYERAKPMFLELERDEQYENVARFCLGYICFREKEYKESVSYFKLSSEANFRIQESNQMLIHNYLVLKNDVAIEGLKKEDENLKVPELD